MISQRFESLLVLEPSPSAKGRRMWVCKCDCGNLSVVSGQNLRAGRTRSCGCLQKAVAGKKHGQRYSLTYSSWSAMKSRCSNPKHKHYDNYGGRGITFCPEWKDFKNFLADMGERPAKGLTLDRKDPDKGYNKENCRWATWQEQNSNKREKPEDLPF